MGSLHPSLSQTPTTSGNFCQDTAYSLGWSTPTGVTCLALAAVEADVIFFPSHFLFWFLWSTLPVTGD